jgi:hypothetical protein
VRSPDTENSRTRTPVIAIVDNDEHENNVMIVDAALGLIRPRPLLSRSANVKSGVRYQPKA